MNWRRLMIGALADRASYAKWAEKLPDVNREAFKRIAHVAIRVIDRAREIGADRDARDALALLRDLRAGRVGFGPCERAVDEIAGRMALLGWSAA